MQIWRLNVCYKNVLIKWYKSPKVIQTLIPVYSTSLFFGSRKKMSFQIKIPDPARNQSRNCISSNSWRKVNVINRFLFFKYPRCRRTADNSICCTTVPPPPLPQHPHPAPFCIICILPYGASVCVCDCVLAEKGMEIEKTKWKAYYCSWFVFLLGFHPPKPLPSAPATVPPSAKILQLFFERLIRLFFVQKNGEWRNVIETVTKTVMCIVFDSDRIAYSLSLPCIRYVRSPLQCRFE